MTSSESVMILGMLAVTFGIRYFLFALADRIAMPPLMEAALQYIPPAVLTAITVPAVLLPRGEWFLSWTNPYLFAALIPTRSSAFLAVVYALSALLAAGGVGMFLQSRWGLRIAAIASITMLVACITLVLLLVTSAAYLHGIYDGIGQAGAAIGLIAALLSFQVVGLLPALQLAHLRRLRLSRVAADDA